jgi:hypothetical protein
MSKHKYDQEKCNSGCDECGIPHDTGRVYVCEKCFEFLDEKHTIETAYPDAGLDNALLKLLKNIDKECGNEEKPAKRYHKMYQYRMYGGTQKMCLCGPMHPETQEEYYIKRFGCS